MSRSAVNLYAEFLLNISQVTIFATLDLKGKDVDTAHFFSDRKRIEITYAGDKAAITYPNGISGTAVVHLPIKAAAQVSLRLEITEKGDPYWKNSLETLNASPWAAHAFSEKTIIACGGCKTTICEAGRIRAWKDLPRGDWAETMDLWHCHKPTEGVHGHSTEKANTFQNAASLAPRTGTAYIDSSNIILSYEDANHVKFTAQIKGTTAMECENCEKPIGQRLDTAENGLQLNKWNVAIKKSSEGNWEDNSIQNLLSVRLLELSDSQASKRFLIEGLNGKDQSKPLLIWVLNPDLKYCASYIGDGYPRRAMKVLYKDVESASSNSSSPESDSSFELPDDVLDEIRRSLTESNEMLPPAARKVQGWTAGLLERFNPAEETRLNEVEEPDASSDRRTSSDDVQAYSG